MSEPIDDLAEGLARAQRKPWLTRSTLILGALVLVTAGFIVGLQMAPAASATPAAFNRNGSTGFGQAGGQGFTGRNGGGSGSNATTGKVKLVDGTTVYVELTDGTIVTVKVSDATKVLAPVAVKSLKAGTSVTVQGQTGSDGTITAGTITTSP